ncbi:hypothetical protein BASU183_11905 [Bacillus subtilis]
MLDKIGIPKRLAWGFLGVVLFMMGDGLEQGWLSPFLIENGLTVQQSASIFSIYGIALAIASWFLVFGCMSRSIWRKTNDVYGAVVLCDRYSCFYRIWI